MADTLWIGYGTDKLYLQSGQFTSTLKTSEYIGSVDLTPFGISWDGTNTPWCGSSADKLYLQSGQFTSTLKTSESVGSIETALSGISWDGTNTPWCGYDGDKLYLQSGQFTSTVKTSQSIGSIDGISFGIEHGDYDARVGASNSEIKSFVITNSDIKSINGISASSINTIQGLLF